MKLRSGGLMAMGLVFLSTYSVVTRADDSANTRLRFFCSHSGDASYLLVEGSAVMETSIEGTIAIDTSKQVEPAEEGYKKYQSAIELKYRMKLSTTSERSGTEMGLGEGHISNSSVAFYEGETASYAQVSATSETETGDTSVSLRFREKTGWRATIHTNLDSPQSSESLKSILMRGTVPCSVVAE